MNDTTRSQGCSQRTEFVWRHSFVKRKELMKGKETGSVSGRFWIKPRTKRGLSARRLFSGFQLDLRCRRCCHGKWRPFYSRLSFTLSHVCRWLQNKGNRQTPSRKAPNVMATTTISASLLLPEIIYTCIFVLFLFSLALIQILDTCDLTDGDVKA